MLNRRPLALCVLLALGCDGPRETPLDPDGGPPLGPPTLETDAVVSFSAVYDSGSLAPALGGPADWIPMDLSVSPNGDLWVVQRVERHPSFDDDTECVAAAQSGAANACAWLSGGTVTITDPAAAEAATEANGRATVIVDYNAWHFMRRPSAIAFGATELRIEPGDPGTLIGTPPVSVISETMVLPNTFGTCHEHHTGNFTDQPPFIGPTLWTSDPAIYNGNNGDQTWSNGSHLDMVHATEYCMGLAYDEGSVYWTFNGALGTIDRYDFQTPHVPGHHDHQDGLVVRYEFADALARLADVPSNLEVSGDALFIADTGNGRVVRLDRTNPGTVSDTFRTHDNLIGDIVEDVGLTEVIGASELGALWGARVEPSGIAMLDQDTMVVASHASGHLTILRTSGEVLRTIDTGTGEGLGGVTVRDGAIYFVQMRERRVYRVDVDTTMRAGS